MGFEIICIILVIISFYVIFIKRRKAKGKVLSGPKGLPVLGSIFEIDDENIHFKFTEYAEHYGEIYQVKLLFDTFIVLNSERIIRKCFGGDRYKHVFNDRAEIFYGREFACDNKALSFVLDGTGSFHKTARKKVIQALHAYGSGLQDLEKNAMAELTSLHTRIETTDNNTIECVSTIFYSISNVLSLMLIGEPVSEDEKEKNMFLEEIHVEDFYLNSFVNFIMSVFPFIRYIPGRYRTEFLKAKSVNAKIVKKLFYDMKRKLQEEFDREIGRERMPTFTDRSNCTFFKAFEMEVHRYITVVPLMLPHSCKTDVELEGYGIKRNSKIIGNSWYVHHNKEIWGDPWTFRPERFLDEHGNLLPFEFTLRKNLIPFGHGLRQCPGESLARTRYFLYISTLLQRWYFEFPAGKQISCDPRLSENFDISVVIRTKPFDCSAKKRIYTSD